MLFIVIIALIILLLVCLTHCNQHFTCKCRKYEAHIHRASRSRHSRGESIVKIVEEEIGLFTTSHCRECCCVLLPVDDEEFDFFPVSFVFYLVFMMMLYLVMIVNQIISRSNNDSTATHALLDTHHLTASHAMDYMLIYGILIVALWSSLFSFYRYYSTFISTTQFEAVSTKQLFSRFKVYALVFCVMFMLQIHLYYYLFPINIILFCCFNFYCTHKFSQMLVQQFKLFEMMTSNEYTPALNANEDVLRSVRCSKYISFICSILQSLCLCLFVVTYNVTIIYYLPILLDISAIILSINFVRNRLFFRHKLLILKHHCKCLCYKTVKVKQVKEAAKPAMHLGVATASSLDKETDGADMSPIMIEDGMIYMEEEEPMSKSAETDTTKIRQVTLPRGSSLPLRIEDEAETVCGASAVEARSSLTLNVNLDPYMITQQQQRARALRKQKALELLGIPHTPSHSVTPGTRSKYGTKTPSKIDCTLSVPKQSKSHTASDSDEHEQTPEPESVQLHHQESLRIPITTLAAVDVRPLPDIVEMESSAIKTPNSPQEVDEVMISLQLLAKYGFCSRTSIKAMSDLVKYQSSINAQNRELYEADLDP